MANVFLSWGTPHEADAKAIANALRGVNLSVWLSADGMRAGQDPYQEVNREISTADTSVFLLSSEVVNRPWVVRELEWAARESLSRPRFRILPFFIGKPPDAWPAIIRDRNINVDVVESLDQSALNRIMRAVRDSLGLPEPIPISAALFAMTEVEFSNLADVAWQDAANLCLAFGMRPPLIGSVRSRYAAEAEGFKPFGTRTLKDSVERIVNVANAKKGPNDRPILLEWQTPAALLHDKGAQKCWSSRNSILFVDSISLAVENIRKSLLNLTWPNDRSQSSVVWIPPYSVHTATLDAEIEQSVAPINWLRQAFSDFVDVSDLRRAVAFDLVTPAALDHWLLRLLGQPFQSRPSPSALADMARDYAQGGAINPLRDFHRTGGGTP